MTQDAHLNSLGMTGNPLTPSLTYIWCARICMFRASTILCSLVHKHSHVNIHVVRTKKLFSGDYNNHSAPQRLALEPTFNVLDKAISAVCMWMVVGCGCVKC